MRSILAWMIVGGSLLLSVVAEEQMMESLLEEELTVKQDALSGDVQEIKELQTQDGVILKLEEMESIMVEATLKLLEGNTGGETIATQTEIIEKAYEAAREKQQSQSSSSDTDKALMDMLKKMLGKEEPQEGNSGKNSPNAEKNAGKGADGSVDAPDSQGNPSSESSLSSGSTRTVPSAAPTTGELLPSEFQELIDEYNQ